MTRRALVTGAAGFTGRYLCRALLAEGWDVWGVRASAPAASEAEANGVAWIDGDLRDAATVTQALDAARPDAIFHLAAISHVPEAREDPATAMDVNAGVAARLLSEVRRRRDTAGLDPVTVVVGSSEQYGKVDPGAVPLRESEPLRPITVYAATKVAQEAVALTMARGESLRVIAVRAFSHSGRGQGWQFLLPSLARRAVALRRQGGGTMSVGNLSPVRDFSHVEDVARAYVALAEGGVAGEVYNVCSGQGVSVQDLAQRVLRVAGVDAEVRSDPALVRAVETPTLIGDNTKLRQATGWSPQYSLDDVITELLDAAAN